MAKGEKVGTATDVLGPDRSTSIRRDEVGGAGLPTPPPAVQAKIESEVEGTPVAKDKKPRGKWTNLRDKMEYRNAAALATTDHKEVVPENTVSVKLPAVPGSPEERMRWVREALSMAAPRALMELINHLYAKDTWSRYRAACEVLDRAGVYKGADVEKQNVSPLVVVNITAKDIWRAGVVTGKEPPTIDITPEDDGGADG